MSKEGYSIHPLAESDDYLGSKVETSPPDQDEIQLLQRMKTPCFQVDKTLRSDGVFEIQRQLGNILIASEESIIVPGEERDGIEEYLREYLRGFDARLSARKISELSIRSGENIIAQPDLLPPDYTLITSPGCDEGVFSWAKVVAIHGLDTPDNIWALFHESAHVKIGQTLSNEEKTFIDQAYSGFNHFRGLTPKDKLAAVLKHERDASALALKLISPLIKTANAEGLFTKEELLTQIHKADLYSHGKRLQQFMDRHRDIEKRRNEVEETRTKE